VFIASLPFYKKLSRQRSINIARYIAPLLPDSGQVLDFGCGNGYTALEVLEQKPAISIVGVDVVPDQNLNQNDLNKRFSFIENKQDALPFADSTFDASIAASAMHHTFSPEFYVDELIRCTKPGGSIILVEEMYLNMPDKIIISAQDWFFNKMKKGIPVPLHFRSNRHYLQLFKDKNLEVTFAGSIRPCPPYIHHYVYRLKVNK